ncbi:MAG: hypothetical protein WD068_02350 [Candidatus Babeliales bacterium]
MDALALLELKVAQLVKQLQMVISENDQCMQQIVAYEEKIITLQAAIARKEQVPSVSHDSRQAHAIINGLIKRIDSLLESPR